MSDFNENQNNEQVNQAAAPVTTEMPAFSEAQVIEGAEPAKKKPIFLIIAIIVVVLAAGCAAAYNFIPWVKNNVKMRISSPEKYYAWVEEENVNEAADKISESYGKIADTTSTKSEIELKADIDPTNVGALIEELTGSPLSSSGITLPSSLSVKAGADVSDGVKSSFQLSAVDKTLATLNMYIQDGTYYYQIPEISPAYLTMNLNDIMEAVSSEMDSQVAAFMEGYLDTLTSASGDPSTLENIISEKELNELIVKYFTIVFENVDDVELEKGVSCKANGAEAKYNMLTADIDQGTLFSIAKDALKEAKKDKTIIKIVEKFGVSNEDYTAAIDSVLDELGSLEVSGGETLFKMNVYVDSKGAICGREIEIPDEENVDFGYYIVEDGDDTSYEVNLMADNQGVKLSGKSTEKSNKESGDFKLSIIGLDDEGDFEIPISYKDIEVVNESKGYTKGEFSIDFSGFDMPVITLALDSDGKSQTIKSDITVDGTNYGTITLTSKEELSMDIPAFDSSQKTYQITEEGDELQQYLMDSNVGLTTFINDFGAAFGVDGLGSIFGSAALTDDTSYDDQFSGLDETVSPDVVDTAKASYDFSKLNIQFNGQTFAIPSKIDGILNYVKAEESQVEAGSFASCYSDDYTFGVTLTNNTDKAAAPADCVVSGFSVSEGAQITVSVDGITIGSNISDVVSKYGATLEDPNSGYVTIYDTASDWNDITFYYYEGKINSIYMDIYE